MLSRGENFTARLCLHCRKTASALLQFYAQQKALIPYGSRWFSRRYEHKSWFEVNDTEASLAIRSGTAIAPQEVQLRAWFEHQLDGSIAGTIAAVIAAGDFETAFHTINRYSDAIAKFGENFLFEEALFLYRRLRVQIATATDAVTEDALAENLVGNNAALAFCDVYGHCMRQYSLRHSSSKRVPRR